MKVKRLNDKIKYKEYFTIEDLINHLQQFDPSLPVGTNGHFGEFIPMDKEDFEISTSHYDPNGKNISKYVGWRDIIDFPEGEILKIRTIDIGPEPD